MKLKELATLTYGVNAKRNPQGDVFYLQARDFLDQSTLDPLLNPEIMYVSKLDKHFLKDGDVLVLSKGHHGFPSFKFSGEKEPAVASAIFMVLRELSMSVIPEYLTWHLNLSSTQKILTSAGRGSALPAINKSILEDLEIPIPDLSIQELIVNLSQLKNKESKLVKKLDQLKSEVLEHQLKEKLK